MIRSVRKLVANGAFLLFLGVGALPILSHVAGFAEAVLHAEDHERADDANRCTGCDCCQNSGCQLRHRSALCSLFGCLGVHSSTGTGSGHPGYPCDNVI